MNGITLVFPIVTALFILLFFLGCPAPKTAELGSDAAAFPGVMRSCSDLL